MLTDTQKKAAAKLLTKRPPVVPGTAQIVSMKKALRWLDEVQGEMNALRVATQDSEEFCDLAGVQS
jgi:hypothetical protein